MTDLVGYLLYAAVLVGAAWLLAGFMARVYAGERTVLSPVMALVERGLYRLAGVAPERGQGWAAYAMAVLAFNAGRVSPPSTRSCGSRGACRSTLTASRP